MDRGIRSCSPEKFHEKCVYFRSSSQKTNPLENTSTPLEKSQHPPQPSQQKFPNHPPKQCQSCKKKSQCLPIKSEPP